MHDTGVKTVLSYIGYALHQTIARGLMNHAGRRICGSELVPLNYYGYVRGFEFFMIGTACLLGG